MRSLHSNINTYVIVSQTNVLFAGNWNNVVVHPRNYKENYITKKVWIKNQNCSVVVVVACVGEEVCRLVPKS